ncbi:MAG: hypothetical protein CM15mV18_0490 [uncultured marine virus]|nr:MAG: hypothetical protein CM15mV18_0490 [uncultured marine virus]
MEWLKHRVKEVSSWHGGDFNRNKAALYYSIGFCKMDAWTSIAWGLWAIWKKD